MTKEEIKECKKIIDAELKEYADGRAGTPEQLFKNAVYSYVEDKYGYILGGRNPDESITDYRKRFDALGDLLTPEMKKAYNLLLLEYPQFKLD